MCYNCLVVQSVARFEGLNDRPRSESYSCDSFDLKSTSLALSLDLFNYIVHTSLQRNKYYQLGMLMAMSIVQGGSGFPFLAPPIFQYICGVEIRRISISNEDVPEYDVKKLIEDVSFAHSACQVIPAPIY